MEQGKKVLSDANIASLLAAARDSLKHQREYAQIIAEQRRIYYNAYIDKGFSKEEALVLC